MEHMEIEGTLGSSARGRRYGRKKKFRKDNRILRMDLYGEARYPFRNKTTANWPDDHATLSLRDARRLGAHVNTAHQRSRKHYWKRLSSRKFRHKKDLCYPKGNKYRRTVDYWWMID